MGYNLHARCTTHDESASINRGQESRSIRLFMAHHDARTCHVEWAVDNTYSTPDWADGGDTNLTLPEDLAAVWGFSTADPNWRPTPLTSDQAWELAKKILECKGITARSSSVAPGSDSAFDTARDEAVEVAFQLALLVAQQRLAECRLTPNGVRRAAGLRPVPSDDFYRPLRIEPRRGVRARLRRLFTWRTRRRLKRRFLEESGS